MIFRGIFFEKVLKICSKFTGEHPRRRMISTVKITLLHGCSVDVQCIEHIFRGAPLVGLFLNRIDLTKGTKDLRLFCSFLKCIWFKVAKYMEAKYTRQSTAGKDVVCFLSFLSSLYLQRKYLLYVQVQQILNWLT